MNILKEILTAKSEEVPGSFPLSSQKKNHLKFFNYYTTVL